MPNDRAILTLRKFVVRLDVVVTATDESQALAQGEHIVDVLTNELFDSLIVSVEELANVAGDTPNPEWDVTNLSPRG